MEKDIEYSIDKGDLVIALEGNYTYFHRKNDVGISVSAGAGAVDDGRVKIKNKEEILDLVRDEKISSIKIDGEKLEKWDSSLAVIMFELIKIGKKRKIVIDFSSLPTNLKSLLELAFSVDRKPKTADTTEDDFVEQAGLMFVDFIKSFKKGFSFLKEACISMKHLFLRKAIMRRDDFLFALEDCSYKAVPIVLLISFMVGLILAFVGSIQLRVFGAEIYVASLVSIAMVRIMGAVMTAIIMSGRTGANYAATIGTMQVNEEIDALKTMGVPVVDFLLLPRILSLLITMPFLTLLSNIIGIIGGASVGIFMLNIPPQKYYQMSMDVLSLNNFLIGIFHGFVFGIIIALCGCYYGINCGKDADSVGKSTTQSVVASIVWIIIATGLITLLCEVFNL